MRRAIPWLLAATHTVLLLAMLARIPFQPYPGHKRPGELSLSSWHMATGMMVAGRDIHHDQIGYALLVADLPVVLLGSLLDPLVPRALGPMRESYFLAGYWFVLGAMWWFGIGWVLVRCLRMRRRPSNSRMQRTSARRDV